MKKVRLFTPGPTPLIPEAQLAMAQPLIHHRTAEFSELFSRTQKNLQEIFCTEQPILILSSSGTGAMEAAVTNLIQPDDPVLAVVAGKFGERWADIAQSRQARCQPLSKEYGEAATADEIGAALQQQPGTAAVLLQGCETSTGTMHDLEAIAKQVRKVSPETLIIVDAITALGSQTLKTDDWDLDVVVGGSQKAFGIPPGLAFLSLSQRAQSRLKAERTAAKPYYFDLPRELANQEKGKTAFTPAVALVVALEEATRQMSSQGLSRLISEVEIMARAARSGLQKLGFQLVSKAPANAVTAAFAPPGLDSEELRARLETGHGVKVAGGQGPLKGRIIRIAHLGYFDILDVVTVMAALELTLIDMGASVSLGEGVAAALSETRSQVTA